MAKVISSFNIDLSDMAASGGSRYFSVEGDIGAIFSLEVKNEDGYYYNFKTNVFAAAKSRLKELLKGQKVSIQCTKEKGKFGRILADVVVNDKSINQQLIDEGHARKYMGGKKEPWIINE